MKTTNQDSGFVEVRHTADWSIRAWAPDLKALLITTALAMYQLADTELNPTQVVEMPIRLSGVDRESLLVVFLSELLYLGEQENLGFNEFDLHINELTLSGVLKGAEMKHQRKEIKAVTYHGLEILETDRGLEATIIFDV